MKHTIKSIPAKSVSYSSSRRSLSSVVCIVIHYTAGNGDTATNEGYYFARTNTRSAGAHFFVDQAGTIVESISMDKIAWAVGGSKYSDCDATGGGKYYGKYTNSNTVSIELCDLLYKKPSDKMINSTKWLIKHIQSKCPNAKVLCYHHDITGKHCPNFAVTDKAYANNFFKLIDPKEVKLDKPKYTVGKKYVLKGELQVYAKPTTKSPLSYKKLNDTGKSKDKNKNGKIDKGSVITCRKVVVKENGNQFVKISTGYLKAYTKSTKTNKLALKK